MGEPSTTAQEFRLKLYVTRVADRRRFYEELMRWPVREAWDGGVMFDAGAAMVELLEDRDAVPHSPSCDVSLKVADVWTLWAELKQRAEIVFPLRDNPWGDTSFCIADPGGFHWTFFTPHGRKRPGG